MPFASTLTPLFRPSTFPADGRNWSVQEPIVFITSRMQKYRVPVGSATDGASTPQIVWSLGLPPFGLHWLACVVHDAAYRRKLEYWAADHWTPASLSREQADDLLLEALQALGVPKVDQDAIYLGVRAGGQPAWDAG
jgi:hypothetical protein